MSDERNIKCGTCHTELVRQAADLVAPCPKCANGVSGRGGSADHRTCEKHGVPLVHTIHEETLCAVCERVKVSDREAELHRCRTHENAAAVELDKQLSGEERERFKELAEREKRIRVNYQDIVYAICNLYDRPPKRIIRDDLVAAVKAERRARWKAELALGEIREVVKWYAEQARLCRLIHSEGDAGRNALANDGGELARKALSHPTPALYAELVRLREGGKP